MENEKTEIKEENKDVPIVSHYSQIRGDVWDAYHQFTMIFAHMVGLEQVQKINGKEYRNYKAQAVDFALQFYGKVMNSFPQTWVIMEAEEEKDMLATYDKESVERYLKGKGSFVDNYKELMKRFTYGDPVANKKGEIIKRVTHVVSRSELAFLLEVMNQFVYHSGISKIEGRFSDKEDFEEPVMRA